MAITNRQNRTLAAEDWTRIYQTFQNADFQSYDFETLRKSMIDYLRLYYPENFNDYIESSEYIALIDLIAWLGQNLAFRTDLNSRENFIDTAERRDSVLKLAKLINYNPKRTQSAQGFLKIDSVSTTESVLDSDGINLANIAIAWNDVSNENWLEQFRTVLNAALINSQIVGKPGNSQTISGVRTEEYSINLTNTQSPVIPFQSTVNDVTMNFEVVSATSLNQSYLYERPPLNGRNFNILYRSDNLGNSSDNTGFFVMFKQGTTSSIDLVLNESLPNRVVNIDVNDVNQEDQWLYQLNSNGIESTEWTKTATVSGINVIYNNSLNRNIYQINSRANDQISLVFGDGSFANIPIGNFRFYYRVANGITYKIGSQELQNIILTMDYVSRTNRIETLTLRASLKYTVNNASARETLTEIKTRAPQQYYTQSRMISGEDYNIYPYTAYSNILKVKALNRTSSGISKYLELVDASGKYSRTNIFAQDGVLYKNKGVKVLSSFSFSYSSEIESFIRNTVTSELSEPYLLHFYYENYPATNILAPGGGNLFWVSQTTDSNLNTGYFVNSSDVVQTIGSGALVSIKSGSILELTAPVGKFFNAQNQLTVGTPVNRNEKTVIYVKILSATNGLGLNNTGINANGYGAVAINNIAPTDAIISRAIPEFSNSFSDTLINSIKTNMLNNLTFGLAYDNVTSTWSLDTTIDLAAEFDLSSGTANWLLAFEHVGNSVYNVKIRSTEYYFDSVRETNFYFDADQRIFDAVTGTVIKDQINILNVNSDPLTGETYESDMVWNIYDNVTEIDGYQNPKRVLVTYADLDNDSIPDNPYLFEKIVRNNETGVKDLVFFRNQPGYDNITERNFVDNQTVVSDYSSLLDIINAKNFYPVGQLFYATNTNLFYQIALVNNVKTVVDAGTGYLRYTGRQNLYFQYQHNANNTRRIDPSTSNIIDIFVLTKTYNDDYTAWIRDTTNTLTEPERPTTDTLNQEFSGLDNVKSISDTLIMNPARFKPLFGAKAPETLRAIFKVVKNPNVSVSDNEIKTTVISAINTFFEVENWDFGETFYFTELSAYLHSSLAPNIASIIIVPTSADTEFGDLFQVNAEPHEIITSAATVDNVEIISAVTASQIGRL